MTRGTAHARFVGHSPSPDSEILHRTQRFLPCNPWPSRSVCFSDRAGSFVHIPVATVPAACWVCLATLGYRHKKPFPQLVQNLQLLLHCFIKKFSSVTSKEMSQYFNNCQTYLMCTLWEAGLTGPGRGQYRETVAFWIYLLVSSIEAMKQTSSMTSKYWCEWRDKWREEGVCEREQSILWGFVAHWFVFNLSFSFGGGWSRLASDLMCS